MRYLEYHAGSQQIGLSPVRKSIHLVIGGAVHAGMEVLLREGQDALDWHKSLFPESPREVAIEVLFNGVCEDDAGGTIKYIRAIEDRAVEAALRELGAMSTAGVELDAQEKFDTHKQSELGSAATQIKPEASAGPGSDAFSADSAINVTFDGWEMPAAPAPATPAPAAPTFGTVPEADLEALFATQTSPGPSAEDLALLDATDATTAAPSTPVIDTYLQEELKSQIEGMIRAYARRRLRPLLTEMDVLEVEREGEWKLTEIACRNCGGLGCTGFDEYEVKCTACLGTGAVEIWFASRHDALLRERSTGFLYLQSYKTTGSWDRRKEQEAQIDMQGLSEAVDVDRRLAEAWQAIQDNEPTVLESDLVSPHIASWLATLPAAPQVLGVRYEYLIKGARRQDKKDQERPGRYVCESPLIRAYQQAGITDADRRWSPSYEWWDLLGKSKRVDYRSWSKAPVWRFMPIARWIDLLDDATAVDSPMFEKYDADGNPCDLLADQFVNPIHVYRQSRDHEDMLQQLAADERRIAQSVAIVRLAEQSGDPEEIRKALNEQFPQNRRSTLYPGRCSMYDICYGNQEIRTNPEGSGLYEIRTPNHPQPLE